MDEHTRYEVGRFYMVPHVRTKWPGYGNPNWIPIIGPSHTDLEVIGFEHEHWHVDFRFLSAALKRRSRRYHVPGAEVFALPIIRVYPLKYIRGDGETCEWEDSVMVSDLAHKNLKRDSYLRFRRSKCKEQYPELPFPKGLWWQRDLEAAYSDTRLKPGLICPHRGADPQHLRAGRGRLCQLSPPWPPMECQDGRARSDRGNGSRGSPEYGGWPTTRRLASGYYGKKDSREKGNAE